ncbi:hypothetical protein J3R30DRAFT_1683795 [Lentinula aciculospora]|uniref:Zn(2)-C6 fungal-type domain-containing protein n=1 Tax=Lentinula aciculospora TaxID=153920 RepID=A0A9W8ZVM0_9AGAR|nr:hypothetical protein J3R30DRAFT_1683795 [Lentinula aciculospora]
MDSSIEISENNHLVLRIPKRKLHMSPQTDSDTKTRCDRCRKKNLKCDRVVPSCQNCEGLKECKYTLQNHSHRGIPRCATCQKYGLKCDRDMPACNQCQLQGKPTQCAYLPRRRRNAEDKITFEDDIGTTAGTILKLGILDKNEPSQSKIQDQAFSSAPSQIRRFTTTSPSDYQGGSNSHHRDSDGRSTRGSAQGASDSSSSHPQQNFDINSASTKPQRSLSQFSPLPSVILRTLSETRYEGMPDREAFSKGIKVFLKTLMPEMQESASLSSAAYTGVARYLVTGEIPPHASPYLQTWMTTHRLLPGSQTHPLILIPRDPIPENLALSLQQYQADPVRYTHGDGRTLPEQSIFDRLPVQDELYDILAYAHRAHKDSTIMTDEVRQIGFAHITWPMADIFVRLCPVCAPRNSDPGESQEDDD